MIKPIRSIPTLIAFILFSVSATCFADALSGEKQIFLVDNKGKETAIGTVMFSDENELSKYNLHLNYDKFRDYFLSMKEMKCLEGPELWCHLSYPYKQPHTVSSDDLSWLSHDLLFMYKKKEEFGANFWNGIYYHMKVDGEVIRGEAQAVDLNSLASPPDDLLVPPLNEWERHEIETDLRWLPYIVIR